MLSLPFGQASAQRALCPVALEGRGEVARNGSDRALWKPVKRHQTQPRDPELHYGASGKQGIGSFEHWGLSKNIIASIG